jgi:glycosyltransferase involved in cell wall biosynthesis
MLIIAIGQTGNLYKLFSFLYAMKVLQVGTGMSSISAKSATATESVAYNLSKELSKLCEVHILDFKDNNRDKLPGVIYHDINMPKAWGPEVYTTPGTLKHVARRMLYTLKTLVNFIPLMSKEKFDIIHCHNQYTGFVLSLMNRLFYKSKFVYTLHTPFWTLANEMLPRTFWLKTQVERQCFRNADEVIAVSETLKKSIENRAGVNSTKVVHISNGVDLIKFYPGKSSVRKMLARADEKLVLCVARISRIKNQMAVIKAIPKVLSKDKDVKFIFAGQIDDQGYLNEIMNFVNENNLQAHVKFIGSVENSKMPEYYRAADIFILPSFAEGLPLVLLEAMASGLAIISSNIAPNMELGKNKEILYFNPGKSGELAKQLASLLENEKKRILLGKFSRKTAEKKFSWREIAKETFSMYKRLIKN